MNKAKAKDILHQIGKRPQALIREQSRPDVEEDQFWQSEIQLLASKEFASIEDAVQELSEKVCAKLECGEAERSEQMQFLMDLFLTDPGMLETLSKCLTIKK